MRFGFHQRRPWQLSILSDYSQVNHNRQRIVKRRQVIKNPSSYVRKYVYHVIGKNTISP